MQATLKSFLDLALLTLRDPREGLRAVQGLGIPQGFLWQLLLLVIALSVVLAYGNLALSPVDLASAEVAAIPSPFLLAIILGSSMLGTVFAAYFVGRACGGTGRFDQVLLAMIWMQAVMLVIQVAQTLVGLILPPLGDMIALFAIAAMFWLLTNFVAEVHGFTSLGRVFLMILATILGVAIGMAVLLVLIGATGGQGSV
ncbi:Yip1 family protein [Pseudoruegeria sp. SHC-113]|uniref:Yip1 family protein n=1 Tax=Pseudoruegeria sp. SHC-113 TaxID=2855439 RepID=UPI0021BADD5F|nr:Yip1 family protein [Pseudoruegeria sp. SHC-113]MCT8160518.1 YIP1 family protein [Pseudoruegeria sp. SHC-113]